MINKQNHCIDKDHSNNINSVFDDIMLYNEICDYGHKHTLID